MLHCGFTNLCLCLKLISICSVVDDPVPSQDVSCASSGASMMEKPLVTTPKVDRIDFHEVRHRISELKFVCSMFHYFGLKYFCVFVQFALNWIKTMRGNRIVDVFQHKLQAISEGERYVPARIAFAHSL